ncbi:MAG: outer membrane lipoprotein-sorting protein [Terriglobia bacterium]|jgi:outer membrane lipoprotein-sorting protein
MLIEVPSTLRRWIQFAVTCSVALLSLPALLASASPILHKKKPPPPLGEILERMNDSAKRLKTVSADLEYTKVTVVVDDKSTEYGELFFQTGKNESILINFHKPDPKAILFLFKQKRAEIYLPKSNQIQEYDFEKHSGLVEQFLLLGFGTEIGELRKHYGIKMIGEEVLDGDTTAVLELTPLREDIASQLTKVQLWVSEESWIPTQQKFFESDGDYLITRYTAVKVNRELPSSTFRISAPKDAKRVKMG